MRNFIKNTFLDRKPYIHTYKLLHFYVFVCICTYICTFHHVVSHHHQCLHSMGDFPAAALSNEKITLMSTNVNDLLSTHILE